MRFDVRPDLFDEARRIPIEVITGPTLTMNPTFLTPLAGVVELETDEAVRAQLTITDGNDLWSDSLEVEILDGIFTTVLGEQQPIDELLFATSDRWLGINVGGAGELPERYRITTSPIAIHAKVAESLPPGSVDGGLLVEGTLTLDKLAPCAPTEIIAMGPSGWACKSRGGIP